MTLFWDKTGPLMKFSKGILRVEDLNPQVSTKWRMTRFERLKTGVRLIVAAMLLNGYRLIMRGLALATLFLGLCLLPGSGDGVSWSRLIIFAATVGTIFAGL